jgi:ribonuclease J
MAENARIAAELGYLHIPPGVLGNNDELSRAQREKTVILVTGSQGEPTSGLVRIASGGHKQIHLHPTDTVVFSASPIPGNESLVNRTVDALFKQGVQVFYGERSKAHVHGHASQEELKLLQGLVKPRFFLPIHGEYRHLTQHAKLAQSVGVPPERTFVLEDGEILELDHEAGKKAGKVTSGNVYVDGLSVGDVGGMVLRSRRMLSRDGIVVAIVPLNKQTGKLVGRPEIVSRGFIDMEESRDMVEGARDLLARVLDHGRTHSTERGYVENEVKDALDKYFYDQTKRRPMILPVLVQV